MGAVIWIGDLAGYICDCTYYEMMKDDVHMKLIYTVIKPIIYTSYWYNCVTELIWTECVD